MSRRPPSNDESKNKRQRTETINTGKNRNKEVPKEDEDKQDHIIVAGKSLYQQILQRKVKGNPLQKLPLKSISKLVEMLVQDKISEKEFKATIEALFQLYPARLHVLDINNICVKKELDVKKVATFLPIILKAFAGKNVQTLMIDASDGEVYEEENEEEGEDFSQELADQNALALAEFVRTNNQLKYFDVSGLQLGNSHQSIALFEAIAQNNSIEVLDLSQNYISVNLLKSLAAMIARNHSIKSLSLIGNNLLFDNEGNEGQMTILVNALKHNKTIERLNIEDCELLDEDNAYLIEIINRAESAVREISLTNTKRDRNHPTLQALARNRNLTSVKMTGFSVKQDEATQGKLGEFLTNNQAIKKLDFDGSMLDMPILFEMLAAATRHRSLQMLSVATKNFHADNYNVLAEFLKSNKSLQVFNLTIEDKDEEFLTENTKILRALNEGLKDNPVITRLVLNYESKQNPGRLFFVSRESASELIAVIKENKNIILLEDFAILETRIAKGKNISQETEDLRKIVERNKNEAIEGAKNLKQIFAKEAIIELDSGFISTLLPRLSAVLDVIAYGIEDFKKNPELFAKVKEYAKNGLGQEALKRMQEEEKSEFEIIDAGMKRIIERQSEDTLSTQVQVSPRSSSPLSPTPEQQQET